MRELNNIKIIAVDHGYGNIKTANTVTPTGVTAYETEPIFSGNILEYGGKYQAWIGYKEATVGNNAFKVERYYHTDWMEEDELPLKAEGLSLDAVYENFVRQLAGAALEQVEDGQETLQKSVQRSEQRAKLQKQIESLQAKIRKEKQLNKQMEMNAELKKLKKFLSKIDI